MERLQGTGIVGVPQSTNIGNPFAKSKINAFKALCQGYAPEAFELIKELIDNRSTHEAVRFQALKFVVEQAYGKASQSVHVRSDGDISAPMMSTEQLRLAAAGQTQELVCNLIETGKLDEYTRAYHGIGKREEKDITEVKDDHLGVKSDGKSKRRSKNVQRAKN